MNDGIYGMLPREKMAPEAIKLRDTYAVKPGAPFVQKEFGFFCLDRWYAEGLSRDADLAKEFGYDKSGWFPLRSLGWCEAGFAPIFDEIVLEDRGDYELVQDFAGRGVLCFKGRRSGFMPEYVTHPVKDDKTWEENCAWRMDPNTAQRQVEMDEMIPRAIDAARRGLVMQQGLVGGYMYLRALVGPEELLYMFYDNPQLIHRMMQQWFDLADNIIARHQQHVSLDEVFIGEDICYNHGPLISPDMMREFLIPYYQQLLTNAKSRQIDKSRRLHFQVDTDGFCDPTIDIYREIGMTFMSPFEGASNCSVLRTGAQYPDLIMSGGVDKRILATTKEAIDRMVDSIFPVMQARGGFIPTCDHGVPEEVSFNNYRHFRKRCLEFA